MATNGAQENCVDCQPAPSQSEASRSAPRAVAGNISPGEAVFQPPSPESLRPSITIEFCDRCRWAPRAIWVQTELFLTFQTPVLRSITLQPLTSPETGGRFRVWLYREDTVQLIWDRKTEGGFPELKVLKQRIRNILQPEMSLGHSDKPGQPRGSQLGEIVPPTEGVQSPGDASASSPGAQHVQGLIDRARSRTAEVPELFTLFSLRS